MLDNPGFLPALILSGLALLLLLVYFHVVYSYWRRKGVTTPKPIPPFGNFAKSMLSTNPGFQITQYYRDFEGLRYIGLYSFTKPTLLLRDPQLIKNVMVKDFAQFYSRGFQTDEDLEPMQGHLIALSGPKWRNLRVKLTPTFTSGKMKMMFPTMMETGQELREYLRTAGAKREVVEMKDILARYSTDVIASCAFGISCNCLKNPNAEFRTWGKRLFDLPFKDRVLEILNFLIPSFSKIFKINIFPADVSKYFRHMVRDTVEYREANNIHRNDFMQLMIQLKNKTLGLETDDPLLKAPTEEIAGLQSSAPFEVTMDVIAAQAFVFFAAGFETSSTTMTFCLYELACNPDIQSKLRKEIDSVLKKNDGKITYEAIMDMEYLDKVVNETLRKYPPVSVLTRECTQTSKLRDTDLVVEKGLQVMLPVRAIHHDPKYYPNPEEFDPERFSEEEKRKRPPFSYLAFGEGPRLCIGMRFGLMQTKIGLISVLSDNEVQVSQKTRIPLEFDRRSFILSAKDGMWLKVVNKSEK